MRGRGLRGIGLARRDQARGPRSGESRGGRGSRRPLAFLTAGRTALGSLTLTLALVGCGGAGRADPAPTVHAPRAPVVRVTRHDLTTDLDVASELKPQQEIDVYAKVSGYIQSLNVDWGSRVHQGDTLAVLLVPELEQQLQLDQSAYEIAHITYGRLAAVAKSRPELVAQEDLDVAQEKDASAKGTWDRDRALFAYTRITAPFAGVVTRVDAYTGALLPAGTSSNKGDQALCHLAQTNPLRLVIPVPEQAVPAIQIGELVRVTVSALNRTLEGRVVRVSDEIDPETRTMHTEVELPNPDLQLVPGMDASVKLPLRSANGVLAVPVQALQATTEGRGSVLVVDPDGHVRRTEVTLGLETAALIEVAGGLRENDFVVFGAQGAFHSGELVTPVLADSSGLQ
jgi:RND family efflux transporter MFP subunit